MKDALVVSFEEDAHAVDNVVGGFEERCIGLGRKNVRSFPGHFVGPYWRYGGGGY